MNISSSNELQRVRPTSRRTLHNISRTAWLPIALLCATGASAQGLYSMQRPALALSPAAVTATESTSATPVLPEDPSAHLATALTTPQVAPQNATKAGPFAPKYSMVISVGYQAQPWTAREKFIGGLRDTVSPISLLGDVLDAGYSDITNGQPNYGSNREALGKRVGATFLRDGTETFFAESVMAPVLHEDPRYYVEGPHYGVFHRALYSVTRPIITRTDSGHSTVNGAVIIGYAGASALSYAYYPEINKNAKDTAATFGGSLGGAAIGDFVSEFLDDVLQAFHIEKRP